MVDLLKDIPLGCKFVFGGEDFGVLGYIFDILKELKEQHGIIRSCINAVVSIFLECQIYINIWYYMIMQKRCSFNFLSNIY